MYSYLQRKHRKQKNKKKQKQANETASMQCGFALASPILQYTQDMLPNHNPFKSRK